MSNAAKYRKKAVEFEQLKQIDRAIASYVKSIEESEGAGEEVDVALFNKVGDLALRQGRVPDAITYYERAVEHYSRAGLTNNAIALCNKILRNAPGRSNVYFTLGRICARRGLRGDATRNFLEYATRMKQEGRVEEGMRALAEAATVMPELTEVAELVESYAQRAGIAFPHKRTPVLSTAIAGDAGLLEAAVNGEGEANGNLVFIDIDYGDSQRGTPRSTTRVATPVATPAAASKSLSPAGGVPHQEVSSDGITSISFVEIPVEDDTNDSVPFIEPLELEDLPEAPVASAAPLPGLETTSHFEMERAEEVEVEAEVSATPERPRHHLDPHQFVQSGELPPLLLADTEVEHGLATAHTPAPIAFIDLDEADTDESQPHADTGIELLDLDVSWVGEEGTVEAAWAGPSMSPQHEGISDPGLDVEIVTEPEAEAEAPIRAPGADEPEAPIRALGADEPEAGTATEREPQVLLEVPRVPEPEPEVEERAVSPRTTPTLPTAAVAAEAVVVAASRVEAMRAAVAKLPQNWLLRRRLAEALLESGEREAALHEMETAEQGLARSGEGEAAAAIVDELVHVAPERIPYHQRRVELAVKMGNKNRLQLAYLDLADALVRLGEEGRAHAVYARVLELDPYDDRARTALGASAPPPPPPRPATTAPTTAAQGIATPAQPAPHAAPAAHHPTTGVTGSTSWASSATGAPGTTPAAAAPAAQGKAGAYVDLATWLEGDGDGSSTRMRMHEPVITGDEQADFETLLEHFKEGVARSLGEDDFDGHYDLGVAYKEMGLLDDAIGEFQQALRSRNHRLPAYEALGQCFVEQERYQVAVTVLSRALHEPGLTDEKRIGVLYLLGHSCEALQRKDEARGYFQRVYATDIRFRDVAARLAALDPAS